MMSPRSSLFVKILFWLFLNLTFLPIILIVASTVFNHQIIIHDILSFQSHDRMRKAFMLITEELAETPERDWNETLKHFAVGYQVDLVLMFEDGTYFSSIEFDPDPAIQKKVSYSIEQSRTLQREQSEGKKVPLLPEVNPIHPDLLMQTEDPNLFWTGVVVSVPYGDQRWMTPAMLASVSDSVTGNGFLFDPMPWLMIFGVVGLISIVLWIPVIRHITQPLGRMMRATEKIATGNFDVAIPETRQDEIGRLGKAINRMSRQLEDFVKGQRRFMGDVAHELGSPIARIQFGLGALEQRVDDNNKLRVQEVMEDVNHMSELCRELLELTRIDLATRVVNLESVQLLPLIETAVRREFHPSTEIIVRVPPILYVLASPDLLLRAISNLIRNAVKYAGEDGPVTISATQKDYLVQIEVRDNGPGVSEEYFEKMFEPFYRPDASRNRDLGGTGLGLAIVKSCVDSCDGNISVANLEPRGFSVTVTLKVGSRVA